ncbi:outer membrane protein assembly factor BamD [Acinetobacter sp. MD2]|uniref:outer membrane protein assembly factor BamD n=1 Tax=Acinetobacter sp. MD2 TaxID=2600066 RepID=UPI002D1E5A53|nr:outer membrane protein assembly factor BamD [Acinetobacter sp. MD2]MEB3767627.1 outer membrane protein assembly factor BamD [Acinetobacter sp. MD2]
MSLPRYKVTMLALSLGIASTFVGCSSNPAKKEVTDLGPKSSEQVYFDSAEKALNKGQYTEAAKNLQAIDTYFPTGSHAEQAQLDLIYVKFQQKDYPGVVTAAERFIRLNPEHPQLAYAYYARGVANMEQNYDGIIRYTSLKQSHRDVSYLKVAYQNFVDLIRRFPSSSYSVDAALRMKYINQELAEHEMEAARYNIERSAWVAAAQRGQWVIEHYPQTPQTPEALATVAYSYGKLGDNATAQQYTQILKLNYPQLVKANGNVNLAAARNEGSFVNKLTLGIFGRSDENAVQSNDANSTESQRSLTNRLSFGLLGKSGTDSEASAPTPTAPQAEQTTPKRSLTNRLSFGLLGKSGDEAETAPAAEQTTPKVETDTAKPKRSWTNRLSLGLLDKSEQN